MKSSHSLTAAVSLLALSLTFGWLGGGCTSPSRSTAAPKAGNGIIEYRKVAREAHRSVAAAVNALEALPRSFTPPSTLPTLAGFDRALGQLELASAKARSRAEAIIARGQSYFDEWKEQLTRATNQSPDRVESERYSRLYDHFGRVRQKSTAVREEFRPFMAKLREFRARLDGERNAMSPELYQSQIDALIASGRRVLQCLETVSVALDDAEAELHATHLVKP